MTEYSRNSRLKAGIADSNTYQRSKEGPTHPYSGTASDSPSQYTTNPYHQPESPEDEGDDNFQVSLQYIMPLIETIKDENEHLNQQKSQIQSQMTTLHSLSSSLLTQNQQLRRHYTGRTSDIKKLIQTISINAHEEINDVTHQSHLIKESNCTIVKQIERLMRAVQQKKRQNMQKKQMLEQIGRRNVQVQNRTRAVMVNNKQMFYQCEQLQIQQTHSNSERQQEQINELLSKLVQNKTHNRSNLHKAKLLSTSHNEERPLLQENLISLTQKNIELQAEVKELEDRMKMTESERQEKSIVYENSHSGVVAAMREYERSKGRMIEQETQRQTAKKAIQAAKHRTIKAQSQLQVLQQKKLQLTSQIAAQKAHIKQRSQTLKQSNEDQYAQHHENIKKIRSNLALQQASTHQQINTRLLPESQMLLNSIEQAKQQYAVLVQEVNDIREGLNKLDNPVKQIVRVQYQLRKQKRDTKK